MILHAECFPSLSLQAIGTRLNLLLNSLTSSISLYPDVMCGLSRLERKKRSETRANCVKEAVK